ncbi:MAG: class I SAM-dependent methyltransferase [Spirochaetota bacterium]
MDRNPKEFFSGRVEQFRKYRIGYPAEVIDLLQKSYGLTKGAVVADIGAGVGRFTAMLAPLARTVYAIEPFDAMRSVIEKEVSSDPSVIVTNASAEATGLAASSVDLITAAQSFQWFDASAARHEFMRILKPDHYMVMLWNDREIDRDDFHREYEFYVRGLPLYREETHKTVTASDIEAFYGNENYRMHTFHNEQKLDRDGLIGRFMSATYAPKAGEEGHDEAIRFFTDLFDRYAKKDAVTIHHTVELFAGKFS